MTLALLFLSFLLTVSSVWMFRKLSAGNSRLLDVPNERSSHTVPVTRGAGIAIVLSVLGIYIAAFGSETNLSYVLAAMVIALVSFLDDLFSMPLPVRLAIHFVAAGTFVFASGAYGEITFPFSSNALYLGPLAASITVVFIVWTINAFNFMDGIDGIAGAQGAAVAIGWMFLGNAGSVSSYSYLGAIMLGSCFAFLLFNWQPAKVFMGDVGSTFLGFTFAVFPLIDLPGSRPSLGMNLSITVMLLWLFLFDTVFTRIQLVLSRRAFWSAHREHLYQRVVRSGRQHFSVALFFGLYSVAVGLALASVPSIGSIPLTILLVVGPIYLLLWPKITRSPRKSSTHAD